MTKDVMSQFCTNVQNIEMQRREKKHVLKKRNNSSEIIPQLIREIQTTGIVSAKIFL